MPNLLQIQGTGNTPTHGRATFSASPTIEAISHYWCWLCRTHFTKTGNSTQQNYNKGLYFYFCFATRAIHIEVVTSLTTKAFLAALRRFIARRGKPRTIYSDNGTTFKGAANQLHAIYDMLRSSSEMARVQDFLANEGCHMPHTSEDCGRQLSNQWNTIWREHWVLRLPPMRNYVHSSLKLRPAWIPDLYVLCQMIPLLKHICLLDTF